MVKDSNASVEKIGDSIGRSRNSIYEWMKEDKAHNITLDVILKLSEFSGLDPRDYFDGIGELLSKVSEPPMKYHKNERFSELMELIDALHAGKATKAQIDFLKSEIGQIISDNERLRKIILSTDKES